MRPDGLENPSIEAQLMHASTQYGCHEEKLLQMSLVTPSYNARLYLFADIVSVLGQDYPHLEYLAMDGGSADG